MTLGDLCKQSWKVFLKEGYIGHWVFASQDLTGSLLWSSKLSNRDRFQVSFSLKNAIGFRRQNVKAL